MKDQVVLVDEQDFPCGSMEKYEAHRKGRLHRAFSIFVINDIGQVLLQKRAGEKYHSPGLWSNTCCSHPRPGEDIDMAAGRRLKEEMGFECELTEQFSFIYKAFLNNSMIEHEFDHVFFGRYNNDPFPDPAEVEDWKWVDVKMVSQDLADHQENYTYWFSYIWEKTNRALKRSIASGKRVTS